MTHSKPIEVRGKFADSVGGVMLACVQDMSPLLVCLPIEAVSLACSIQESAAALGPYCCNLYVGEYIQSDRQMSQP